MEDNYFNFAQINPAKYCLSSDHYLIQIVRRLRVSIVFLSRSSISFNRLILWRYKQKQFFRFGYYSVNL